MDDAGPAPLLGGRYRLARPLGRGGMSDVHVARDELLDRDVAVKLVRADRVDGAGGVDRLEREARATARLSHPNVVVVHDVLREGDDAAIVMELVPDGTLADRLRTDGPLDWPEAIRVIGEVAAGLGAAHAAGLVHRDVKPSNVLLGPGPRVRVADFGIAAGGTSTETTTVRGSIPYLAPEQARGEPTDPRTDVYALGCVLYEVLTGRPPFDGDTGAATVGQHLHRPPPRPADVVPGLPVALDTIVGRMLAKDPKDRPADMTSVALALDEVARRGGDATAVLPPAPTEPIAAPATRRPSWRPAAAAVAVLGLAALAWQVAGPEPSTSTEAPPPAAATTASPSPTATTDPSPSPTPTATSERPTTVVEATSAFRRVLVAGREAGEASAKAVDELDERVSEIVRKADEGKGGDVRDKARELVEKVDELQEKGELTSPELARRLRDAARELERVA